MFSRSRSSSEFLIGILTVISSLRFILSEHTMLQQSIWLMLIVSVRVLSTLTTRKLILQSFESIESTKTAATRTGSSLICIERLA